MFDMFANDILKTLPQRFSAYGRERRALSNKSTKVFYDEVSYGFELTLLVIAKDNADLSVGDRVVFEDKNYEIYQIQIESRIMLRLFLKESNMYEG